jgi:Nitrile hydratase, alpha chain
MYPEARIRNREPVREKKKGEAPMSEASGRQEMERRLVEKSLQDDAFRQRLLEDPKAAVEQELGTQLPEDVRVVAVEETSETIYLVLPSSSPLGEEGDELSDRELEAVAGGWDAQTAGLTCTVQQTRCGVECA